MIRQSRRALLVCGALLAGQALFLSLPTSARSVKPESPCEALKRWARAYEGTTPTLDQLAQYDRAHRIAIFNAVSPTVRASLVQDELRRFSARADLSDTQRALINEAITLVTPAFYRRESAAQRVFDAFWARADKAFTTPEQRRPWFEFGATLAPAPIVTGTAAGTISCECSTRYQDCGGGIACLSQSCSGWSGCGPLHNQPCDGMCNIASASATAGTRD